MNREVRIVGLDISKDTVDAGYFEDERPRYKQCANTRVGFKQLVKWSRKRGIDLRFCMEATGAYNTEIAEYLHAQGFVVYVENARLIKAFRESENERNMTDKSSARIIALYAMSKVSRLRQWQPIPPYLKTLQELTRFRDALVQSRIQWNNRLKSRAIQSLAEHAEKVIVQIKASIKEIDAQIRKHISVTPELKRKVGLLKSIKGIGVLTAAVILSEVPWIDLFESKKDLVAFAGLNPALRKSGTSIDFKPMLSKKGSSRIRKALYMPAIVAKKYNTRMTEFASRLEANGKTSMQVVGACMAKLLCFAFGVLHSGEPFHKQVSGSSRTSLAPSAYSNEPTLAA